MKSTENTVKTSHPASKTARFRAFAAAGVACLSALLFLSSEARAQATPLKSFLKIDAIQGECTTIGHVNEIELIGFASGVERAVPTGGTASKPQLYEVQVSKNVDKSSPKLFVNCAMGKSFPSATLTVAKVSSTGAIQDYYKVILTNVVITRVQTSATAGSSGSLKEEVALSFARIQWSIATIDPKTGQAGAAITGGYDLQSNTSF